MARGDIYTFRHNTTCLTAITVLQAKAGANYGFRILCITVTQRGSTTSAQEEICLVRKSGAATVTLGAVGTHVFKHDPNAPTPDLSLGTSATGVMASGEGTDGDIIKRWGFNVLNGMLWVPQPKEVVEVPVGGIVGLKYLNAPASQNWTWDMVLEEV